MCVGSQQITADFSWSGSTVLIRCLEHHIANCKHMSCCCFCSQILKWNINLVFSAFCNEKHCMLLSSQNGRFCIAAAELRKETYSLLLVFVCRTTIAEVQELLETLRLINLFYRFYIKYLYCL